MDNARQPGGPPALCSPAICEAVETIRRFVAEVTGYTPSDDDIAAALKRYFVLNEIKEHIGLDSSDDKVLE